MSQPASRGPAANLPPVLPHFVSNRGQRSYRFPSHPRTATSGAAGHLDLYFKRRLPC